MRAQSSEIPARSLQGDGAGADALSRQAEAIGHGTSTPYFPEVESLRGIAMALVYSFHIDRFVSGNLPTEVSPLYAFVRAGHTGVSLFFVLSGFLLTLPFIEGARHGRPIRPARFYSRRALRILPLYYTAVIIGTIGCAREPADLLHGLPYLLFLNAVAGWAVALPDFGSVWWSLGTEMQFYALLPLLGLALRSRLGRALALAALVVWAAAYVAFLRRDLHMATIPGQFMLQLSLFAQAPMFLVGITVAFIYSRGGPRLRDWLAAQAWLRRGGADAIVFAVFVALGLLLQWQVRVTHTVSEQVPVFAWHLLEAACWGSIVGLVLMLPVRARALWRSPVLGHLGIISYSMYMWHIPVARFGLVAAAKLGIRGGAGWTPINSTIIVVLTLICLGISELTYRYIERPFLRRKARLS